LAYGIVGFVGYSESCPLEELGDGKFHTYSETRLNNQINDKNTVKPNAIFNVIHSHNPSGKHTT
jgi:hypothetical protein